MFPKCSSGCCKLNLIAAAIVLLHILLLAKCFPNSIRTFDDPHLMKFLSLKDQAHKVSPTPTPPVPKTKRVSYYGESCETSEECAPNLGLTCKDSSCVCITPQFIARLNPLKLFGNHKRTECVLRAGSKCGLQISNSFADIIQQRDNKVRRAFPTYFWNKIKKNIPFLLDGVGENFINPDANCVDNAHCIGGMCTCSADYFKDNRGLCLKKRTLFQPCEDDDDEQCRASEGLQCVQGKCQCQRSMIFDKITRKCFIPVGGECDAYSSNPEEYDMECVRNAECSNSRCLCMDGFIGSQDGTCGVAHGKPCDGKTALCSDLQLTCRSGHCQCRYPVHQVYNETLGECLSKPDGPCTPQIGFSSEDSLKQNCVPYSECVMLGMGEAASVKKSIFDYTCKCIQGYAEDPTGNCIPSFSTNCVEDEDCDEVGQLSCVQGVCSCPDGMLTWDETRRKCVGLPGARCKFIQLERILSMRMDIPTECVENALCMEHVSRLDGRCECKGGHQFSQNYLKCIPTSGSGLKLVK